MDAGPARVTALIHGPDRPGIVAGVTGFIYAHGGNILYLDQHTDPEEGLFFMRVQFAPDAGRLPRERVAPALAAVCAPLGQESRVFFSDRRPRLALLASRAGHCLSDLLFRWREGALTADIALVASNHPDLAPMAAYYGVPFHHLPVTAATRGSQEERLCELCVGEGVDTLVLARYMQVLTPRVVGAWPAAIINIHHSFLPAFAGANPYRQAFLRGVKVIGATSHYVTEELDAGPIIAQETVPVSHRDTVEDLRRKGQDVERLVLARAVALHATHRVMVHGGKTVVFGD